MKGINKHTEHNRDISTIMEVFLNQKRINVCEYTVKKASHDSFESHVVAPSLLCVHIHLFS